MKNNITALIEAFGVTKADDIKGSHAKCVTAKISLIDYIRKIVPVMSLDRNPRKPMYKGNVHNMVRSLHSKPEFFVREHPGVSICLEDALVVTNRQTGATPYVLHFNSTPYVFNGGHTTMALVVFTLEVIGATIGSSPTWEKVIKMISSAVGARRLDHLPAREYGILSAVKVPIRVYFPKKTTPDAMKAYIAEVCDTTRNVNAAEALSKSASAEAAGFYAAVDKMLTTRVQWKDGFGTVAKYRRDAAIHVIGLCVSELQNRFPDLQTGVKSTSKTKTALSVYQAFNTMASCVDNFVAMLSIDGVMNIESNEITDTRVRSLFALMQDMFDTYDLIGKYFTTLFHKRRAKSYKALHDAMIEKKGQRSPQCPFGTQVTDENLVSSGLIVLVLYGALSLLNYDVVKKEYTWLMKPQDVFNTDNGRSVLAANVLPLMEHIRYVFKEKANGGFFDEIRKMYRDTTTWTTIVRQAWTRTYIDLT